jgi:hypothetical protein
MKKAHKTLDNPIMSLYIDCVIIFIIVLFDTYKYGILVIFHSRYAGAVNEN